MKVKPSKLLANPLLGGRVTLRVTVNVESADGTKFTMVFGSNVLPNGADIETLDEAMPGTSWLTPSTSVLPPGLALPVSSDWSAATPV